MGAMEANCGKCLHQKVCALWWAHERQDASCFSLDGCDCFEAAITSPNEPLTLEQLREMDGEPVWVETKAGLKFWGIVTKICVSSGDGRYLLITEDTEYGQTWVAYRRPPEGEEG